MSDAEKKSEEIRSKILKIMGMSSELMKVSAEILESEDADLIARATDISLEATTQVLEINEKQFKKMKELHQEMLLKHKTQFGGYPN